MGSWWIHIKQTPWVSRKLKDWVETAKADISQDHFGVYQIQVLMYHVNFTE